MRVGKAAGLALGLLCVSVIQGCFGVAVTGTAASAVAAQDRRTAGSLIDDELIELKVLGAIHEDETLSSQAHVNATSVNGRVLLTGEAPGESLRSRVTEIARNIPRVREVQNEVALQAPSTLLARTGDSLVTLKVKTELLKDNELSAMLVKVVTERGIVYLMGLVTQEEADRATEVARRVSGVQRVVRVMEYTE